MQLKIYLVFLILIFLMLYLKTLLFHKSYNTTQYHNYNTIAYLITVFITDHTTPHLIHPQQPQNKRPCLTIN